MNRSAISLGRILGIPIRLDYSWFLIFALLTWSLAASYFPAEFKACLHFKIGLWVHPYWLRRSIVSYIHQQLVEAI